MVSTRQWPIVALACLACVLIGSAQTIPPSVLKPLSPRLNNWFRLASEPREPDPDNLEPDLVHTIEASADLSNWSDVFVVHGSPFEVTDPSSASANWKFYRSRATVFDYLSHDWKNQVRAPVDAFSSSINTISWIKFAITTNEPTRVYFANSALYSLHYDFVTNRVPGFAGLTHAELDRVSLFNSNRQVYLGTIIQPWNTVADLPRYAPPEYGIQFVGRDPIAPEKIRELFDIVRVAVRAEPQVRAIYIPTFEQSAAAEANREYFETNGIPLGRADDWIRTETAYSLGWAIGRLVFVSAANVNAAYSAGTLRPSDILLTDGIPAELPYVSGIITFAAATPNSHVAILAQSYNVPFVFIADAALRARILSWTNREIALQLTSTYGELNPALLKIFALDPQFDPALKSEIVALKQPPPLNIRRKEHFGAYTSATTALVPADSRFFGGKAANFGLLTRVLPTNSPSPSLAISMDLWDDFMAQTMASGQTLRTEISNRLSRFSYPADVALVKSNLATIRTMIRGQTQFTAGQQETILSALSGFATNRNIRFRSSSNVEDSDYFSGAGLYESFSGCSGDDLDGDTAGPSGCDPNESNERGVFRAIRRVYASFYNDNAFLERLRLGVNEDEVGMGILVHYSTPDETEMANGVATLRMQFGHWKAHLVSQLGAVSITNPDGNAVAEEITVEEYDGRVYPTVLQPSNLVPFGEHVMTWDADYAELARMLFRVAIAYTQLVTNRQPVLDFEYKKLQPGRLEIKQVREVPTASSSNTIAPYLLNEPITLVPSQRTYGDLFAAHRLKSRWHVEVRNQQFTAENLQNGLLANVTVEWADGSGIVTNSFQAFSNLQYSVQTTTYQNPSDPRITARYTWDMPNADGRTDALLDIFLTEQRVSPPRNPFVGITDLWFFLQANYSRPVLNTYTGNTDLRTNDWISLVPLATNSQYEVMKEIRHVDEDDGVTNFVLVTRYYIGSNEIYSGNPPLFRFEETRIEGLTTKPIVLHGFFSQTWNGFHRQFLEDFLFEPRLEEGIDPAILEELTQKQIRLIYLKHHSGGSTVTLLSGHEDYFD
jgi:hypothetical protein